MVLCFPPPLLLYIHSLPFQPGYHIVIPNGLVIRPWPLDRSAGCGFWSLLLQSCLLVCIFLALQPRSLSPCGGFCFLDLETKSLSLGYCLWFLTHCFWSLILGFCLYLEPWSLESSFVTWSWLIVLGPRLLVIWVEIWLLVIWDLEPWFYGSRSLVLVSAHGSLFLALESWFFGFGFWLLALEFWV